MTTVEADVQEENEEERSVMSVVAGLSVASLFSGAGGFDLGFEMAGGYKTVFSNELLELPAKTFARHFFGAEPESASAPDASDIPLATFGDISNLKFAGLARHEIDVLIGGPPCQDFSVMKAQNREGTSVKRGKLYLQFVRAIAQLHPKAFVFENVPGLVSANQSSAYQVIQADLQNPEYTLASNRFDDLLGEKRSRGKSQPYQLLYCGVVDAPRLGVPQTRRRLIIVGIRQDVADKIGIFELESAREWFRHKMNGGGTLFRQFPLTSIEVFEGKTIADLQEKYRGVMAEYESLPLDLPGHARVKRWLKELREQWTLDIREDYLTASGLARHSLSLFGDEFEKAMCEHEDVLKRLGYLGSPVEALDLPDGSSRISKESNGVLERMWRIPPGHNYEFVDGTDWEVEGKKLTLIYRRPFPLQPAPTVVAFGGGGTYAYHYERQRSMLTNRERARLQTFNDGFLFYGNAHEMRAQIGEAVPPLLACRVAEELGTVLS